jgi:hypothetical protein
MRGATRREIFVPTSVVSLGEKLLLIRNYVRPLSRRADTE